MRDTTKQIEDRFNESLPSIDQADLGNGKPRAFNRARFLKAAQELQKIVKENDMHESAKA